MALALILLKALIFQAVVIFFKRQSIRDIDSRMGKLLMVGATN
jgi:hypothetical protein